MNQFPSLAYFGLFGGFLIYIKVTQIVSRYALIECPLLHGNIQKETDTENRVYYDFMRFGDSSTVRNPLKQ